MLPTKKHFKNKKHYLLPNRVLNSVCDQTAIFVHGDKIFIQYLSWKNIWRNNWGNFSPNFKPFTTWKRSCAKHTFCSENNYTDTRDHTIRAIFILPKKPIQNFNQTVGTVFGMIAELREGHLNKLLGNDREVVISLLSWTVVSNQRQQ